MLTALLVLALIAFSVGLRTYLKIQAEYENKKIVFIAIKIPSQLYLEIFYRDTSMSEWKRLKLTLASLMTSKSTILNEAIAEFMTDRYDGAYNSDYSRLSGNYKGTYSGKLIEIRNISDPLSRTTKLKDLIAGLKIPSFDLEQEELRKNSKNKEA